MPNFTINSTAYRSVNYWTPQQITSVKRTPDTICAVVWHTSMGHRDTDIPTLTKPGGQGGNSVSSHYYIARDGTIYCLVDPQNAAWHCYTNPANRKAGAFRKFFDSTNENYLSIGVEQEARAGEPLTDAQKEAAAWLQAYLTFNFPRIKLDRDHVVGHYELSTQKQDPQPSQGWDWDSFMAKAAGYLDEMYAPTPEPVPAPAPDPAPEPEPDPLPKWSDLFQVRTDGSWYFPATDKVLNHGFQKLWDFEIDGYPISNEEPYEFDKDLTVQYNENTRFEWKPGQPARRGAISRDYFTAKGRK